MLRDVLLRRAVCRSFALQRFGRRFQSWYATEVDSCSSTPWSLTAAKGRQRRGRADHGTGGHENKACG
jgi:hypothetical protein